MTRCERCGASNPAGATWCGQCHTLFEEAAVASDPGAAGAAGPAPPAPAPPGPARAPEPGTASAIAGTPFRQRDGRLTWACAACGTYNPLAAGSCDACGTAMTAVLRDAGAGDDERAVVDPRTAFMASIVLPGTGHVLAGRPATGIARALLYVVWLGGGVALTARGGALPVTGPLLLGALVLWAGSLLDLANLSRSRPEILGARGLLWLVVGVTLLSVLGLATGVAGAG